MRFGDAFSQRLKDGVDAYLKRAGITPPALVDDPADAPDLQAECVSPVRRLNLREANVSTVIWATGYHPDYSWIDVPVLDRKGRIRHDGGVVEAPGMYVLGLPFMRRRKSSFIDGAGDDAADLAAHLDVSLHHAAA